MSLRLSALACVLLLAGCDHADQLAAGDAASTPVSSATAMVGAPTTLARYDGYGATRFGMDAAAFDQAWDGELEGAPAQGSTCFYRTPTGTQRPRELAFMFEAGHFVRYDIASANEAAPGGGKVGMDAAQIRTLYGARVQTQPHKYVVGAHTLRVLALQGSSVLVFETDERGKVTRWRAGMPPQVDYVEGCA